MHGYAIMQAIAGMTDGRETILPGTLYAALVRPRPCARSDEARYLGEYSV